MISPATSSRRRRWRVLGGVLALGQMLWIKPLSPARPGRLWRWRGDAGGQASVALEVRLGLGDAVLRIGGPMGPVPLLGATCLPGPPSPDAFPWDGEVTLSDAQGHLLTWSVCRVEGGVRITGTHPQWQVEHFARPDGAPLKTVRRGREGITRVTWSAEGASVERTSPRGERSYGAKYLRYDGGGLTFVAR